MKNNKTNKHNRRYYNSTHTNKKVKVKHNILHKNSLIFCKQKKAPNENVFIKTFFSHSFVVVYFIVLFQSSLTPDNHISLTRMVMIQRKRIFAIHLIISNASVIAKSIARCLMPFAHGVVVWNYVQSCLFTKSKMNMCCAFAK